MAIKPLGLSPDYKSVISPNIASSLIFSWTYIRTNYSDNQKSAVVKVYNEGSNTALVTLQAGESWEVDMSPHISKFTAGSTYEWELTVTSHYDNTTASSGRKKFVYTTIGDQGDLEWPAGPESYEYIGTRRYFQEIRENALLVLSDYVINTDAERKIEAAARNLFTGDIVPSRTDFVSLENILGFISDKEMTHKDEVDGLIEDGLGAEDIHKIYSFFDRLTQISPQTPNNVSLSFDGVEPLYITSGSAKNNGEADLSIDVSWTVSSLKTASCIINVGNELSEDVAYYRFVLTQGYNDYYFHQPLYFRLSDINAMGRKISIPMEHPLYHHLTHSKKGQYSIEAVSFDKRGQSSPRYAKSYSVANIPLGVSYFNLRAQRHDLQDNAILNGWYDIYNGPNNAYVHNVAASATGTWRYAVRVIDINGTSSNWLYLTDRVRIDPLKPPAAPKVYVHSTTTSQIIYGWSAVPTAEYYEVDKYYNYNTIIKTTDGHFTLEPLLENTPYNIRVRAVNRAGASAWTTCQGRTKAKPIQNVMETRSKCRTWRTAYEIRYQNGRITRPKAEYRYDMDNTEVIHGQWIELRNKVQDGLAVKKGTKWGNHKSCFFLDYKAWQQRLKGKEIVEVKFYIRRKSTTHGYPYDGRFLHVYTHNYADPGSMPAANIGPQLGNLYKVNNLDWNRGEGHTVVLPKKYGELLRDGKMKGIAFHHPTSDQEPYSYMRFDASTFQFVVRYK